MIAAIAQRPTRPVLRWHGGKYILAPWIVSHFSPHRIYIEPFGGAASVLMAKPKAHTEIYNDLNSDVVNLFRVLRNRQQAEELQRLLKLTPYARQEWEESYKPVDADDCIERARRLIIRSFMGFSSAAPNPDHPTGFRAHSRMSGRSPAGDWANYADALPEFVERLEGVNIENRPAIEIIASLDTPQTLIYADPPYQHSTRKTGMQKNYGECEMSDADHRELAGVLRKALGMVLVSGYRSALYDELYGDWLRIDKAALADGAKARTESLWLNEKAERGLRQRSLFG